MERSGRWIIVGATALATVGLVAFLAPGMGPASTSVSFVPAAIAGALLGLRVGLVAGAATALLTEISMFAVFGRAPATVDLLYAAIHLGMGAGLGWLHDVRDRQREAAQRSRLLFDSNPLPVWVFDDQTLQMLDVNEAAVAHYGYSREAWLRLKVTDLRPSEDRENFLTDRQKRDRSVTRRVEARHLKADGTLMDVVVTATNLDLDGRNVVYAICEDVTERKRAEAALRRTERLSALGTLVAGVAHEINNPLTYMQGNVELAQLALEGATQDPRIPEDRRDELREVAAGQASVLHGIQQIARITRGLRAAARRTDGTPEVVDVDALVRDTIQVAQPRMPAGVDVFADLSAARQVRLVPGEIAQVVLNLLFNAADAVGATQDPRISVRTRAEGDAVCIEVQDNGAGIPEADREKLFVPFYTTKSQGTGLGLSISQRIVADHGGAISFESAPGRGTTFQVKLPRA